MPRLEWRRRRLWKTSMYSKIALASSTRVFQRRVSSSSTCIRGQNASIIALMLLCQVECLGGGEVGDDQAVEASGEVALQAAEDLAAGESFGGASGCVGACLGVVDESVVRDRPERVVALAVAALVEPVAFRLAAGGFDRRDAAEGGESGVAAQPGDVVAGDYQQLAGGVRSDSGLGEQPWGGSADECVQLSVELAHLL